MRSETREDRWRRTMQTIRYIFGVFVVLALVVVILVAIKMPEPEHTTAQERMAQFYSSEEYERMLNLGASEWSAEQAARQVYEDLLEP